MYISTFSLSLTFTANPHNTGRPINTHLAPSDNALNTSVPCLTPPSRYTSILDPFTASTIPDNASI